MALVAVIALLFGLHPWQASASNSIPGRATTDPYAAPSPLAGRLIVNRDGVPEGTVRVTYPGSVAECDFLHKKFPDTVPETGCHNVATLVSHLSRSGTWTVADRTVEMCSSNGCDKWNASVTYSARFGGGQVWSAGGLCHYGGFAYNDLRDWTSRSGDGTAAMTTSADFYVIIDGIPVTVEWHVRAVNDAGGGWHVEIHHT